MHFLNRETEARDNDALALRTIGALRRVPGHVAQIHVMQALGVGDGFGAFEGLKWRGRKILQ